MMSPLKKQPLLFGAGIALCLVKSIVILTSEVSGLLFFQKKFRVISLPFEVLMNVHLVKT